MQALADAREWQLLEPQLADTDGYKRLRVCHMVMQQLQQVLSLMPPGSARAALAAHAGASGTCAAAADAQDGGDGGACPHAATGASACGGPLECAARHMLAAMCVERLMPTLWLNEVRVLLAWHAWWTQVHASHACLKACMHTLKPTTLLT